MTGVTDKQKIFKAFRSARLQLFSALWSFIVIAFTLRQHMVHSGMTPITCLDPGPYRRLDAFGLRYVEVRSDLGKLLEESGSSVHGYLTNTSF